MIRITAGEWKGRGVTTPPHLATRPTQARLRQALFNSIQFDIPNAKILDLFSGSGSLSFEALSRGAAGTLMVDNHRGAVDAIKKNIRDFSAGDRARLIPDDLEKSIPLILKSAPFDFVFADPPYSAGWEMKLLNEFPWDRLLVETGTFCLEWGTLKSKIESVPDETEHLVKIREKVYGDSVLTSYQRKPI
ncbi:MAG: 16S rRNA (guanine(966)-N(2))-methyltransferase RsmD [Cryobacterium sp.]|nr:16S rRNA (guanine(966)-N(2))-methyltransferase RsmD [Oligoflexia bacterium]